MIVPHHAQVHRLQLAVLHEIDELNKTRLGVLEMVVEVVHLPTLIMLPYFYKQGICSIIDTHKISITHFYFLPKYALDPKGRAKLYGDIHKAALVGGNHISLWGKGKMQVMDIRCQSAAIYRGTKVDKHTGIIVGHSDYPNSTYSNDCQNQRHGQQGQNGSHQTGISRCLSKDTNRCPFSLNVFQDNSGYFLTTNGSCGFHMFYLRRDHLRHSRSHLHKADIQLQNDMNTTRGKIGTAANIHYVCSARQGTPTLLSSQQVACLCKKKELALKGGKTTRIATGKIDDIYKFLEQSGNYYVSLLAHVPTIPNEQAENVNEKSTGTSTLFNETHIGNCTDLEDVSVGGEAADQKMLWVVGDHRRELQIANSKEMMVAIAYGMSFDLSQFGLCTLTPLPTQTKRVLPLLQLPPRILMVKCFLYSVHFFLANRAGHTSGFFKLFS
jgi:hypothetical protein